jgi:hypothetical protein
MDTTNLPPLKSMVTFLVNTLHGPAKRAGVVTRYMDGGMVEVRAQMGGYYVLASSALTLVR